MNAELGISFQDLDNSFAANAGGLAFGCILLVPIAVKYGRRPVYIISTAVMLATAIWQAKVQTAFSLIAANVVSGLAGAVSESIVQMTISDLFFVHQRATMNGLYLMMANIGAFLAPVATGYIATAMGWRWIWWFTAIFMGAGLVVTCLFHEETKYVPIVRTERPARTPPEIPPIRDLLKEPSVAQVELDRTRTENTEFPKKSLWKRYGFLTRSPGGSRPYFRLILDSMSLFRLPAVSYTAFLYGSLLSWFSIVLTTLSVQFTLPPYNFSSMGIGLLNLPPFIGVLLGNISSPVNDWLILKLAKRNGGLFEPEMRLWMALPGVIITPAGLLLFGITMADVSTNLCVSPNIHLPILRIEYIG